MDETSFQGVFGFPAQAAASAPGRVNLLGEHTDYNDGFVLPIAIPLETRVEAARSRDGLNHYFACELKERAWSEAGGAVPSGFAAYLHGCLALLRVSGYHCDPVCARVTSRVPMGSGLSSSAALEVAFLRALRELFGFDLDDLSLALMAQQAEVRYAGVNCGIMDQMASSLADTTHMLFLDTRSLERKLVPLPRNSELLVLDSGVPRRLGESRYNLRRQECEEAARLLGLASLRDLEDPTELSRLPRDLALRARHVIKENERVLQALVAPHACRFGELMNESHRSLKEDFQVSTPELDLLVSLLQQQVEVFGARLTGAGFGGACVALVRQGSARAVGERVLGLYQEQGQQGTLLVPR
ncbi:galactokinase [Geomonas subterranea]|uniref:galactokinase n=1 Tax=Geomonas subterranea TaxID=2847989 RepID=UPI001CD36E6E|nr:galactokinase [Geomonas fuzhouensis]